MFKIFSQYECLVKYEENEILLTQNDNLEFSSVQKLNIYPTSPQKISFVLDLKNLTSSQFYKVKKIDDCIYVFIVESTSIKSHDKFNFGNPYPCEIEVSKTEISFNTKDIRKTISLNFNFVNYSIKKIKNLYYVFFENSETSTIIIFNPKNYIIKTFSGNIENNADGFAIHEDFFDLIYSFEQEGLKLNSFVAKKKIPSSLVSFQFMKSIKLQAYSFAYSLLTETLRNEISITQLKEFIPDVSYFKFVEQNKCFAFSSKKELLLSFETNENGISEINND